MQKQRSYPGESEQPLVATNPARKSTLRLFGSCKAGFPEDYHRSLTPLVFPFLSRKLRLTTTIRCKGEATQDPAGKFWKDRFGLGFRHVGDFEGAGLESGTGSGKAGREGHRTVKRRSKGSGTITSEGNGRGDTSSDFATSSDFSLPPVPPRPQPSSYVPSRQSYVSRRRLPSPPIHPSVCSSLVPFRRPSSDLGPDFRLARTSPPPHPGPRRALSYRPSTAPYRILDDSHLTCSPRLDSTRLDSSFRLRISRFIPGPLPRHPAPQPSLAYISLSSPA